MRALLLAGILTLATAPVLAQTMDLPGRSYGGKVRAGPGMQYAQVGSTRLNDRIVLIERSVRMDRFDWFRIRMPNGQVGYQWGGLMCADGEETGILTICGSQQDRELSGLNPQPRPQPRSAANVVRYWCGGESMPMEVRYVDEGQDSVAYVVHDGSRPYRLVKPWGSNGNQYESGRNRIYGRGPNLTIELDGLRQDCREG